MERNKRLSHWYELCIQAVASGRYIKNAFSVTVICRKL